MIALTTILLPIDGSECSRQAMVYALSFANQFGARVVALHVIDQRWVDQTRRVLGEVGCDMLQRGKEGLEYDAGQILWDVTKAADRSGVAVDTRIVTGTPVEEIVRLGEELPADLIIMGTHGWAGVSHALLGSVAEKVVRQAPCPVLTVRPKEHDFVVP